MDDNTTGVSQSQPVSPTALPAPSKTARTTSSIPSSTVPAPQSEALGSRDMTSSANHPISYIVRKGDTLSKISKNFYGTPNRWQTIYDANRNRIPNMNNLRVGTVLIIPPQ